MNRKSKYALSVVLPEATLSVATATEQTLATAMVHAHFRQVVSATMLSHEIQDEDVILPQEKIIALAQSTQDWFSQFFPGIEVSVSAL